MSRTKKLHCVVSIIFSHPHPKTLVLSKLDITIFTERLIVGNQDSFHFQDCEQKSSELL